MGFNPRSHAGSDVKFVYYLSDGAEFQSTLPRRERLRSMEDLTRDEIVSIHAPTQGAT